MGKVLHQYALCDFDAADEFLGAMHPALLEVHAYMRACTCIYVNACVIWHT